MTRGSREVLILVRKTIDRRNNIWIKYDRIIDVCVNSLQVYFLSPQFLEINLNVLQKAIV